MAKYIDEVPLIPVQYSYAWINCF